MLFNSYIFLTIMVFIFPVYYFLNSTGRYIYLFLCSAFFFGNLFDFLIFLLSMLGNGLGAFSLINFRKKGIFVNYFFIFLVLINIFYLAYFKYFFVGLMPLALSFYTFEQITFLYYIAYHEDVNNNSFCIKNYVLFISFFPRLLAGPIYYYDEYKDKIQQILTRTIPWDDIGRGFSIFCLGLFKKVVCADQVARVVDSFYENPADFSTLDTWFATLAYSLQIYFDFSAYSEMAIGVAMMLGVTLPLNFNSPYKATSIIDFWSRWHMTLSRFIKDYIYIPLGGKSSFQTRNVLLTMCIAGIWHGSSLNFLAWGALHGVLISVNHFLRRYGSLIFLPSFLKIISVFIIINTTWIFFRAQSLNDAFFVFQQYIGFSSVNGFHFDKKSLLIVFTFLGGIFVLPNIKDIFFEEKYMKFRWNVFWASFCLVLFTCAYLNLNHEKSFIYFNF